MSSWLAQIETPSAWISLDASDNDPSRFFNYLIAALREIDLPGAAENGRAAEDAPQTIQPPPPESLMVLLINELSTWPMPFVVALDDYHLIEDAQNHDAIEIYDGQKAPPFKSAVAHIAVEDDGPNAIVRGHIDYELKYGPVGSLMDAMMVKSQFNKGWNGLYAGLKHYVETGEEVDGLDGLDLNAVRPMMA